MPLEASRNPSDTHLEPALHSGGHDGSAALGLGASWIEKSKANGKRMARQRAELRSSCMMYHETNLGAKWTARGGEEVLAATFSH